MAVMGFDELFAVSPVMAILRGYGAAESVRLAEQAWALGVGAVEVPIQTPEAVTALRAVAAAGRSRGMVVGSGTVISIEQIDATIAAGGVFTVAPGFSAAVAEECRRRGIPHLPGVATASEIQQALASGLEWVKAFPAGVLGAPWFSAMRGPFPKVKFVATGGVTVGNAAGLLHAGADVVSLGSALADPAAMDAIAALSRRRAGETRINSSPA